MDELRRKVLGRPTRKVDVIVSLVPGDGQAFRGPRPGRVGANDFEFWKVRRNFVDGDGLTILQLDAHAAGSPCTCRRHPAMKQDRHVEFRALFPQRVKAHVVWEKMLAGWVKLAHARKSQVFAASDFVQSQLSGPGIDGTES